MTYDQIFLNSAYSIENVMPSPAVREALISDFGFNHILDGLEKTGCTNSIKLNLSAISRKKTRICRCSRPISGVVAQSWSNML